MLTEPRAGTKSARSTPSCEAKSLHNGRRAPSGDVPGPGGTVWRSWCRTPHRGRDARVAASVPKSQPISECAPPWSIESIGFVAGETSRTFERRRPATCSLVSPARSASADAANSRLRGKPLHGSGLLRSAFSLRSALYVIAACCRALARYLLVAGAWPRTTIRNFHVTAPHAAETACMSRPVPSTGSRPANAPAGAQNRARALPDSNGHAPPMLVAESVDRARH